MCARGVCVGVASATMLLLVLLLALLLVLLLVLPLVLVQVMLLMLVLLLVLLPGLLMTMLTTRTTVAAMTAMLVGGRLVGARRGRAQCGRRSRRLSDGGDGRWRLCMRRRWGRRGVRCPLTPSSACFGAMR